MVPQQEVIYLLNQRPTARSRARADTRYIATGLHERRCMIKAARWLHSDGDSLRLLPLRERRCLDAACYFSVHANGSPELLSFFVQALNFQSHCSCSLL